MRRLTALAALGPIVALLAACGGAAPPNDAAPSPSPPPSQTAGTPIGRCTPAPLRTGGPSDEQAAAAFQEPAGDVVNSIERYARAQRDSFAGVWLDWEPRGVVAAFTKDLEAHDAALQKLATAEIPIRVEQARPHGHAARCRLRA